MLRYISKKIVEQAELMKILFVNYYKLDLTLIECENIFS